MKSSDAIFDAIDQHSQSIAIEYNDKCITYCTLKEQILFLCEAFTAKEAKVEFIEPILNSKLNHISQYGCYGLYMDNSANWIACDLALMSIQACSVPIPKFFCQDQVNHLLSNANVNDLLSDCTLDHMPCFQSFFLKTTISLNEENIYWYTKTSATPNQQINNTIKITYTSGTTSEPKGVLINENSIIQVAKSVNHQAAITENERHLSTLPFSLLLENVVGIYGMLLAGATIVIATNESLGRKGSSFYDTKELLSTINRLKITTMITVPALAKAMIEHCRHHQWRNHQLRFVAVGGAPCAQSIIDEAKEFNIPLYQGYGLSECTSVVCLNNKAHQKRNSVGKVLLHADIKIADDGEILISGSLCSGYLHANNTEDVALIDGKRYWKSGDIGYIKDDFLFLIGRKKLSFCTAFGRNISPEWIEKELTAVSTINHAIVYGEAREFNIAIVAVNTLDSALIHEQIIIINSRLPDYAKIADLIILFEPLSIQKKQISATGMINRGQIINDYLPQLDAIYRLNQPKFLPLN